MADIELAWRLVDANLNRAAEGLRVVEDILRFALEDSERCAEVRALRHRLRDELRPLYEELIAWRRVESDPGPSISASQGLDGKEDWRDLLLANLKRAQEGLRVIEESLHLLGQKELAKAIEQLRYRSYQLESQLASDHGLENDILRDLRRLDRRSKPKLPTGIYALTSEPHSLGRSNLEVAEAILKAGVEVLQYREKKKKFGAMYAECLHLRKMTREAGALFIINDHVALAQAVGADGVHIGQDDLPLAVVRKLLGPEYIIGVSTHSPEQARAAVEGGADYIGVGPLFATQTKEDVCAPVGLEYLDYVVENLDIPFVAIGGIKEHNLAEVVKHGAKTVALVTEIVGSPDIEGEVKKLRAIIEQNSF